MSGATGIPLPFECYFAAEVEVKDCDKLKKNQSNTAIGVRMSSQLTAEGVKPELR